MLESHHGSWSGINRLWFTDPVVPLVSDGSVQVTSTGLTIGWRYEGAAQKGTLALSGPSGALAADWVDTWHASTGMRLHGHADAGLVRLWGTYPAGDGPDWGWRIEVDVRDPEVVEVRMFNVVPDSVVAAAGSDPHGPQDGHAETIAVHLRVSRA